MTHGDDLIQILKLKSALAERDKLIDDMTDLLTEINMIFNMEGRQDGYELTKKTIDRAEAMRGGKGMI